MKVAGAIEIPGQPGGIYFTASISKDNYINEDILARNILRNLQQKISQIGLLQRNIQKYALEKIVKYTYTLKNIANSK